MDGNGHLGEKIFTPMMNYRTDFVNKGMNLSTKPADKSVDMSLSLFRFVSVVNEIVNKTRGRLLTPKSLCLNDFFSMSTMSTKILLKMYGYINSTYYMLYTRARVEYPV